MRKLIKSLFKKDNKRVTLTYRGVKYTKIK